MIEDVCRQRDQRLNAASIDIRAARDPAVFRRDPTVIGRPGPVKLEDCRRHGLGSGSELFVVEGDSASQAVSGVRDPAFQAVLPMQGKPLNAGRATAKKVASHALFTALTDALGVERGARCDPAALCYDRVLLLMDPDADGIHCGVLMLAFFHRWLRPLLDGGHIEVVLPPWGEVVVPGEPSPRHAWSDAQLRALSAALRARGAVTVRRYRGLAGIDAGVLHLTCVAPASRRVRRVTTADAEAMIGAFDAASPPRPRRAPPSRA